MGFLDELENLNEQDTMGKIPGKPNRPITSSKELAKVTEKQVEDLEEKPRKGELGNEEVIESNFNEDSILYNINEALVLIDEAEDIFNEEGAFRGLKEKRAKRKLAKAEERLENAKRDKKVYAASGIKDGDKAMEVADKRIAKAKHKLAKAKIKCADLKCESQDTIGEVPGELKEVKSEKELAKVPMYQKDDIKVRDVKGELGNEEVIEKQELAESYQRIAYLEEKVNELIARLNEQNTVGSIPGKPNGPITSSKELAKVPELQQVEELKPKFDQAPKGGKPIVKHIEEDDAVEKEIVEDERELGVQESVTVENIQVFTREQGKYFISESAFEACCETYPKNSQLDVLYAIAESYDIDVNDIFFLEGEDTAKKRVRAKIDRLKKQLKDTAPSSETAKDLRKRIKQLKAKL